MRGLWKLLVPVVLLAAGGYWYWSTRGPYPITNATPRGTTIVAFGDSLTYGSGAEDGQPFPQILAERLGVPIENRGVPGDTTREGLARLERDVLAADPKIVLLCLGGNDLLQRIPQEETFANLEQMIRRIQKRGALVIVLGLGGMLMPGYGADFRALARRTGCPLVPNVLGGILGRSELMADRIHPNAAGYARMADKIEPVLRRYAGTR